jgi:hypothetical protein
MHRSKNINNIDNKCTYTNIVRQEKIIVPPDSKCTDSKCTDSKCTDSKCTNSKCTNSKCTDSKCTNTKCTNSKCPNSKCTDSKCTNSKCPNSGIISLCPTQGVSAGGNIIIINGYNLINTQSISMNDINVPFNILSNTQIKITAIPKHCNQVVNITVKFQSGSYQYSESLEYTYINNAIITTLTPAYGPITGSNIITITGKGLTYTEFIYFNNVITCNFVVLSDSNLQVVVPNLTGESNILIHIATSTGISNELSYDLIPPPLI